jgi:hypothetical protein
VVAGRPAPVVQAYAQQVVDRLPRWRADGFPPDEAGRVQDLLTPVADGRAQLALQTCPDA